MKRRIPFSASTARLKDDRRARPLDAENWLAANRRSVAALLTEEHDPQSPLRAGSRRIHWQVSELLRPRSGGRRLGRGAGHRRSRYFDETLYLMELANVQLAELEAYDRMLDDASSDRIATCARAAFAAARAFAASAASCAKSASTSPASATSCPTSPNSSATGTLARIYQTLSARFHLADWHHAIDEKLKTLDDLYQLLTAERNNRWMLILEVSVVLLFVIDLVMLALGHK